MILRKPYAFFIKKFKLLHFIIFVLASILLYKTTLIYSFIKEYSVSTPNLIGKDLTSTLFSPILYLLIGILIIVNIIIIIVMIKKEKPYMYYVLNIILYISVLVVYILSHSFVYDVEKILVPAKRILAMRDITNIARLLQTVSVVFYFIRATGFDIRKFDFVRDLQKLDISEEDSEEIEVAIEVEKNEYIRKIKKYIRSANYYYKENKFIINVIALLILSFTFLIIYETSSKYNKIYNENEFFEVNNMNIGIKQSNIITKNYKKEEITKEEILVAVKISINSNNEQQLETARAILVSRGTQYYPITEYNNSLLDLGETYTNQKLEKEFKDYILVYKLPKENKNSEMLFRYIDNIENIKGKIVVNSVDVKLNPKNLDEQKSTKQTYKLIDEMDTTNTNFVDYKMKINNYEIQDKYEYTYKNCVTKEECYDFKEILIPAIRDKEKVILKLDAEISFENKLENINNPYDFIEKFGTIEYIYNNETYKETNDFNQIISTINKEDNIYYIEVNKEIKDASEIKFIFNMRNNKYEYILRGETNE